jgi:ribosomal protein S18
MNSGSTYAWQSFSTEIGKTYIVTGYGRVGANLTNVFLQVRDGANGGFIIGSPTTTDGELSVTFQALSTTSTVRLMATQAAIPSNSFFDNISVKEIPGYHAVAFSDAARPTLMDDPDLAWSDLTDNGNLGPNLWYYRESWASQTVLNADGSIQITSNAVLDIPDVIEPGEYYDIIIDADRDEGNTQGISFRLGSYYIGSIAHYDGITKVRRQTLNGTFGTNERYIVLYANNWQGRINSISVRKVNTAFNQRGTTNLISGENAFDSWTQARGVATGNTQTDPDGGSLADTFTSNITNSIGSYVSQTFTTAGSAPTGRHWFSCYIKAGTTNWAFMGFGGAPGAYFNVSAGTVGTVSSGYEATIESAGNGWFLCTITSAAPALGFAVIYLASDDATVDVTIGDSIHLYGAKVNTYVSPNLLIAANGSDDDSTFNTDTGNWSKGTGWSIGSGVASCDGTNPAQSNLSYPANLEANKWYRIRFYVNSHTTGYVYAIPGNSASTNLAVNSAGWHEGILRADGVSNYLIFTADAGTVLSIDNITLQELPSATPTSYYLDTDGVDDWMEVTPTLNLGEQWWHTGAWKSDDGNGLDRPFATASGYQSSPMTQTNKWAVWYADGSYQGNYMSDGSCIVPHVLTIEQYDTNAMRGTVNGVGFDTFTPFDDSGNTQGLALFTEANTTFAAGFDGRFYGGAWGQGQVDYDELDTLQKYLGTTARIEPTEVTPHTNVYDMLSAQTAAALFDIDDTTSLRVGRTGSDGIPVEGDPVGTMMDVSGTGGDSMSNYLAGQPELVTNGDFSDGSTGWTLGTGWSVSGGAATHVGGTPEYLKWGTGIELGKTYEITVEVTAITGGSASLYIGGSPSLLAVTSPGIYTAVGTAAATNLGFAVRGNSTNPADSVTVDNISVKELPGYIAQAPSDAARPILASVLDTTASELTDDGTRSAELVTNGTFDTDSNWTKVVGATIANGVASLPGAGGQVNQTVPVEIGAEYEVTYTSSNKTGAGSTRISIGGTSGTLRAVEGTYTETLRAISTGNVVVAYLGGSGADNVDIDNISVKKVNTVFDGRGDELVTNGDFSDGATGWSFSAQSELVDGVGSVISTDGSYQYIARGVYVEAGKAYEVSLDLVAVNSGSARITLTGTASGTFQLGSTVGPKSIIFVAGSTGTANVYVDRAGGVTDFDFDNFSVKEVLTPNLLLTSAGDDDSTFDTDTGNWSKLAVGTPTTSATIAGGVANLPRDDGSNFGYIHIQVTGTTLNKWYRLRFYLPDNNVTARAGAAFLGGSMLNQNYLGGLWHEHYMQADRDDFWISFFANLDGETAKIDNVIIQEVPASVARAFYLDFDGVDDNLILPGTDFGSSTNATLYKTFRGDATADYQQIMFATLSAAWILVAHQGSTTVGTAAGAGTPVFRQDGAIKAYTNWGDVFTELIDNTDHTIGVEEANLSVQSQWTNPGFYIGQELGTTWDSTGRLYSWAAVDTRLDGRDRDLLENYMLSKKT